MVVLMVGLVKPSLEKKRTIHSTTSNLCSCRACFLLFCLLEKITIKIYVYLALRYSYFCQVELFSENFSIFFSRFFCVTRARKTRELSRVTTHVFAILFLTPLFFEPLMRSHSAVNFEITKQANLEAVPLFEYRAPVIVCKREHQHQSDENSNLILKVVFARHSTRPLILIFLVEQVYIYKFATTYFAGLFYAVK